MRPPECVAPFTENIRYDIYHAISPDGALSTSATGLKMVVAGARRGIGCVQALTFAKAGVKIVVLAARSTHELAKVEADVGKAAPTMKLAKVATDATDEESVEGVVLSVEEVNGV
jgi:NADP-dependent 3-hydroxy acid dehydrogenase YdfG